MNWEDGIATLNPSGPLRERVEFSRPQELPGIMVLRTENASRMFRWFHDTFTVAAMLDGGGQWKCDRRTHELTPGGLSLWQPGDTHEVTRLYPCGPRGESGTTQRVLLIDPPIVHEAAEQLRIRPSTLQLKSREGNNPRSFLAFRKLHAALEQQAPRLELQSRLMVCVRTLVQEYLVPSAPALLTGEDRRPILEVREFLREHPSDSVSLDQLAALAGMDKFRLLRAFRKETGLPPHAYHLQVRLARARRLLAGGLPPAEAAVEAGFADQSHLTRLFSRSFDITPGRFRRETSPP